jgi:hypothetical protein
MAASMAARSMVMPPPPPPLLAAAVVAAAPAVRARLADRSLSSSPAPLLPCFRPPVGVVGDDDDDDDAADSLDAAARWMNFMVSRREDISRGAFGALMVGGFGWMRSRCVFEKGEVTLWMRFGSFGAANRGRLESVGGCG